MSEHSFNVFDKIAEQEQSSKQNQERTAAAKTAALASISVIRTISKVVAASLSDVTVTNPEETERKSRDLIKAIGEQSVSLYEKLGSVNDPRILPSLTGSVTTVMQSLYRGNHDMAFDVDVAGILADCAKMNGLWKEERPSTEHGSLEFRRTISMMQAMSPVLGAYQRFDFYYGREKTPLEDMQNLLWSTVEQTMSRQPVIEQMGEGEAEMIRRNLLVRAGEMLASAWDTQAPIARAQIEESTPDERRAFKTYGYPLDRVVDLFQSSYGMVEQSFAVTLNSQFEAVIAEDEDRPAGPGA